MKAREPFQQLRIQLAMDIREPWIAIALGPDHAIADVVRLLDEGAREPVVYLPSALDLGLVAPGSLVLAGLDLPAARWLNHWRNAIRTAQLRLVMWLPDSANFSLRREAPDLASWTGIWCDLSDTTPGAAVQQLRQNQAQPAAWTSLFDELVFAQVHPDETLHSLEAPLDPATPMPDGWVRYVGVDHELGVRRALRHMAWHRRTERVLLDQPVQVPATFHTIDERTLSWPEATDVLTALGRPEPARLAAQLGNLAHLVERCCASDDESTDTTPSPPWADLLADEPWETWPISSALETWETFADQGATTRGEYTLAAAVLERTVDERLSRGERPWAWRRTLAEAYLNAGELAKADGCVQATLAAAAGAPDTIDAAEQRSLEVLAVLVQLALGQWSEAAAAITPLVTRCESELGNEHAVTLRAWSAQASIFRMRGNWDSARNAYEQLIRVQESVLGSTAQELLKARLRFANDLALFGDSEVGFRISDAVERLVKEIYTERHPMFAQSIATNAWLAFTAGEISKAYDLASSCVQVRTRLLGPRHIETLDAMHMAATYSLAQGDTERAANTATEVHMARVAILGERHPRTLSTLQLLALIARASGAVVKAKQLLKHVVDELSETIGLDWYDTVAAAAELARTQGMTGNYEASLEIYRSTLDAFTRMLGKEHRITLLTTANRTYTLQLSGRLEEAQDEYSALLPTLVQLLGANDPAVRQAEQNFRALQRRMSAT